MKCRSCSSHIQAGDKYCNRCWSKQSFYKSRAWELCRAKVLTRDNHLCQECMKVKRLTPASTVHHIIHLLDDWSKRLDEDNLISVCAACHNRLHPEKHDKRKYNQKKRKIIKNNTKNKVKPMQMAQNPDIY